MADQQIIDSIRERMQGGSPEEEVRHILSIQGYSEEEINEAFLLFVKIPVPLNLNNYSSPREPVEKNIIPLYKPSTPTAVNVIGWIIFAIGALNILRVVYLILLGILLLGGFGIFIALLSIIAIITISLSLFEAIFLIILSFGIRRMRRWALYTITVLTIIEAISLTYLGLMRYNIGLLTVADLIINMIVVSFLWSLKDKFN